MKMKDMQPWQVKKLLFSFFLVFLVGTAFLGFTVSSLIKERNTANANWKDHLQPSEKYSQMLNQYSGSATTVYVGTYIENITGMSLRDSSWTPTMLVWFRWEGSEELDMANHFRVYKGKINDKTVVKEIHENGVNYQQVRMNVTISKQYKTKRFPLESHQLRIYIESDYSIDHVIFENDKKDSGYNSDLEFTGYDIANYDTADVGIVYDTGHGDPEFEKGETNSELVTQFEINRSSWGVYTKCFIALFGTLAWIIIVLFINTYHRVDPLGMIPGALFGTVSNIMVGANLLPDVLDMGLLEYVNVWGILAILAASFSVINVNRIRNKYEDREYAVVYGRMMFCTITFFILLGNILLPLSAYRP